MTATQETQAQQCLVECTGHIVAGAHEATLRSVFNSHLRAIAGTPLPWWANEHFVKTEAILRTARAGRMVTGFADNLVGLTAIEYEKNLTVAAVFSEGYDQVRQYVAGLLNRGAPAGSVRGVLSDTVRWYAYEVDSISPAAVVGAISAADVVLRPATVLPDIDCGAADLVAARKLLDFLNLHLGRDAGQALSAATLKDMFGLESALGSDFVAETGAIVDAAFHRDAPYAELVKELWANFVSFVGTDAQAGQFDKNAYVCELYLLTLAKLIAANVLNGSALVSSPAQLQEILDGKHFKAQGLTNLVEYDYFGWLTKSAHVAPLLTLAQKIQNALRAFDFSYLQTEDLFGQLVTQLARRTQRLLLGQEPTPGWLIAKILDALQTHLPATESWRFVDPCCGSGAFIVEVVARRANHPRFPDLSREQKGQELAQAITGFDIDPLAVMLAKVSWLVAAKPVLQQFNSGFPLSIPIYHADSLFASTPLANTVVQNAAGDFDLNLGGSHVSLPGFLATPAMQGFFDEFMDGLYRLAQVVASASPPAPVASADVQTILQGALTATGSALNEEQAASGQSFGERFANLLSDLERQGRNGLWLHMLKNGYRPALVRGKFNGVATNFPWLTLSKLADNPYKAVLQQKTAELQLEPVAQSAHHLELATIFLVHAAKHYLGTEGYLAAVVPNSVIQGTQHEPLRSGAFRNGADGVQLHFIEVWDADRKTFGDTNVAAVLVGKKGAAAPAGVQGRFVKEGAADVAYPVFLSTLNERNAWTKVLVNAANAGNLPFRQGADIMPRTAWFHDVSVVAGAGGTSRYQVNPIGDATSPFYYLVSGANSCRTFRAVPTNLSSAWGFEVLTSAHLLQFIVNPPAVGIFPLKPRTAANRSIEPAGAVALATDVSAQNHFQRVLQALAQPDGWGVAGLSVAMVYNRLNLRNKLALQQVAAGDTLVLFGAGGTHPAAARYTLTASTAPRIIVDQTLYWMVENDADKADYLVGLINSASLANAIRPFQPVGRNGPRHIHELPLAVIPPWNAADPLHMNVVTTTRQLQTELATAIANSASLRDTCSRPGSVARRREVLRAAIAALPGYAAYEAACALIV